jgi:hypothetical protein
LTFVHGREEDEWECLEEHGLPFLIDRARRQTKTSYTEFGRVVTRQCGVRDFDFNLQSERTAMGYLLGRIVRRNHPESGLMLSAMVFYLYENEPGPGFYLLAEELGDLPRGQSDDQKQAFWVRQVEHVQEFYRPPRRRRAE